MICLVWNAGFVDLNDSFQVWFIYCSDGRTVGRADGRTVERADGRKNRRTDGRTGGRTDGRTDERTDGRILKCSNFDLNVQTSTVFETVGTRLLKGSRRPSTNLRVFGSNLVYLFDFRAFLKVEAVQLQYFWSSDPCRVGSVRTAWHESVPCRVTIRQACIWSILSKVKYIWKNTKSILDVANLRFS